MSVPCSDPERLFYYRYSLPENHSYPRIGSTSTTAGGFAFTIFANNTLRYETYSLQGEFTGLTDFSLNPAMDINAQTQQLFGYFESWLSQSALVIEKLSGKPSYFCEFGIKNHPLFEIEELDTLVKDPFSQESGHFARRFHLLLEDIAEILANSSIYVSVNSFTWDADNAMVLGSVTY